jgi:hypothetical protein
VHFYGTQDQEAKTSDELAHAMAKIKTIAVDNHATVQQQQVNLQKGMSAMSGKVTALQSEIAKRVTECRVCIRAGGGVTNSALSIPGQEEDRQGIRCSGWSKSLLWSPVFTDRAGYCILSWKLECR